MRAFGVLLLAGIAMVTEIGCSRPGGEDLPDPENDPTLTAEGGARTAVFAGGCFWCVEAVYQQIAGVSDVVSGYAGGTAETAVYAYVVNGGTDHAEAVRITYDPGKVSFGMLLKVFFTTHDPTTLDRQGPDSGRQYRSAVFYADEIEKKVAEDYIRQLEEAGVFPNPIVTTLEPLEGFYAAEPSHQNFVERNPAHPYVRRNALPKVEKVRDKLPELTD